MKLDAHTYTSLIPILARRNCDLAGQRYSVIQKCERRVQVQVGVVCPANSREASRGGARQIHERLK